MISMLLPEARTSTRHLIRCCQQAHRFEYYAMARITVASSSLTASVQVFHSSR
jgi:hypothetical protein